MALLRGGVIARWRSVYEGARGIGLQRRFALAYASGYFESTVSTETARVSLVAVSGFGVRSKFFITPAMHTMAIISITLIDSH
jgi:hypothetical protein